MSREGGHANSTEVPSPWPGSCFGEGSVKLPLPGVGPSSLQGNWGRLPTLEPFINHREAAELRIINKGAGVHTKERHTVVGLRPRLAF